MKKLLAILFLSLLGCGDTTINVPNQPTPTVTLTPEPAPTVTATPIPTPVPTFNPKPMVRITNNSIVVDKTARRVDFTITFSDVPDFYSLDLASRPANSFQFYIYSAAPQNDVCDYVLRGDEIHTTNMIMARRCRPPSVDVDGHGWGIVAGSGVPFSMNQNTISFDIPFATIGVPTSNVFWWKLDNFYYGAYKGSLEGKAQ